MKERPRILIIGGGFGGITLIQKLKNKALSLIHI